LRQRRPGGDDQVRSRQQGVAFRPFLRAKGAGGDAEIVEAEHDEQVNVQIIMADGGEAARRQAKAGECRRHPPQILIQTGIGDRRAVANDGDMARPPPRMQTDEAGDPLAAWPITIRHDLGLCRDRLFGGCGWHGASG
jgi:hypothetical protein